MSLESNYSTQEAQSKGLRHTSRASGSVRVQSPPTGHQGQWPPDRCVRLGSFLLTTHQLLAREDGAGARPCSLFPLSLEIPTPRRGTAPIHGVHTLDRFAVPAAHPTVPIAKIVLRSAADACLVAWRWVSAARAEPRSPVLPPPDCRAPVEAPAAIDAVVIGHDVPGSRAVRGLAALWVRRLRRGTARPRRLWEACRLHGHVWAYAVHNSPCVCHIIRPRDGTPLQPSVVRPHASLAASARKPTAICGPEPTGDEKEQRGSSAEETKGDPSESAPHPRPSPTGRYRESTTRAPVRA